MNAKPKKKKLCWNCEGGVALDVENCPYCGVYLSPTDKPEKNRSSNSALGKSQTEPSSEIPIAPYAQDTAEAVQEEPSEIAGEGVSLLGSTLQPLLLLLTGAVFSIFGLALFLFSHKGVFTLSWNGTYWFLYLLLGVPMLLFGWLSLNKINEEAE